MKTLFISLILFLSTSSLFAQSFTIDTTFIERDGRIFNLGHYTPDGVPLPQGVQLDTLGNSLFLKFQAFKNSFFKKTVQSLIHLAQSKNTKHLVFEPDDKENIESMRILVDFYSDYSGFDVRFENIHSYSTFKHYGIDLNNYSVWYRLSHNEEQKLGKKDQYYFFARNYYLENLNQRLLSMIEVLDSKLNK